MIVLCGDIHGEFRPHDLFFIGIQRNIPEESSIIQVGDFGVGFKERKEPHYLFLLNQLLVRKNSHLYIVRGNHDDPSYFQGQKNYSNIDFVPDYSLREIEGQNFLFVGGATSIDRYFGREVGKNFWEDENVKFESEKLISVLLQNQIDVVVTHSAPCHCFPLFKPVGPSVNFELTAQERWEEEQNLKKINKLVRQEREALTNIHRTLETYNQLPNDWYYGHFHKSNLYVVGDTKYHLLDINEFKEHRF